MKTRSILIVLAVMMSFTALAQKPRHHEKLSEKERAEKISAVMEEKLDLNEEQKIRVQKQYEDLFVDVKAYRNKEIERIKGERKEMKAVIEKRHEKNDADMKKILTKEQYDKYIAHKESQKKMKNKEMKRDHKPHKKFHQ